MDFETLLNPKVRKRFFVAKISFGKAGRDFVTFKGDCYHRKWRAEGQLATAHVSELVVAVEAHSGGGQRREGVRYPQDMAFCGKPLSGGKPSATLCPETRDAKHQASRLVWPQVKAFPDPWGVSGVLRAQLARAIAAVKGS